MLPDLLTELNTNGSYYLWLASWYPNKIGNYDGDFIQRMAKAVALYHPVHVLHLVKDEEGKVTRNVHIETSRDGNLEETTIYYAGAGLSIKPLDSFVSLTRFGKLYRQFLSKLFRERGLPALVHVQVAWKAGMIASWIKRKYGLEYLLTEHWTAYLDEASPQLKDLSITKQYLLSQVVAGAAGVITVSQYLGDVMVRKWPAIEQVTLPNVVDHTIFYPSKSKENSSILKLVHASSLNYQKDPGSLFKALSILKKKGVGFTIDIFGPAREDLHELVRRLGITGEVVFRGEHPQEVLADSMRNADALVLYSRYETFGCVLIEANASGIPVVVTDNILMREVLDRDRAVFVPPADPVALADALEKLAGDNPDFDIEKMVASTHQFSYREVGKEYINLYQRFLDTGSIKEKKDT